MIYGITEMWGDGSCDGGLEWKDPSSLGRTGRDTRRGDTLYINDQSECMELHLGMEEELTENSWIRVKGRAGTVTL